MWPLRRRRIDPEKFVRDIARFQQGSPEQVSRDFKDVFLGTEQGRRVLHQILNWSGVLKASYRKEISQMAFREGERNLGLRVLSTVYGDIPEQPETAQRKRQ